MPIENFNEIPAYIEANKDNEAVKAFVNGLNPVNLDKLKDFVGKDATAKSWLDSEKDKHSNKSLETWKTNNLQKLIDDEVAKVNPQETPEQKRIRELEQKIQQSEKDSIRKELTNKALKFAAENKIPGDFIDRFLGDDEETTINNLKGFQNVLNTHIETAVQEKLKGGYQPPKGGGDNKTYAEKVAEERNKNNKNPYENMWK